MSVCLVGSWVKIPNGDDELEMAENVFLNRDNIKSIPEDREYLSDFRNQHPDVKAALVEGIDCFDDQYFGTGESEAICMDPQQRMLMQGVIHALENSGITIEMASEARVAVYTAAWAYDYKDLLPPDQYMATGNSASVMCGRITYFLNSRGAAVGIETACSSSLVAFHLARQAILTGEAKMALVCGANHVGARSYHSLYNSHMVSPNGRLAAFDRSANGFVRAESFAVAVLCSHEYAEQNGLKIHCHCVGSAFNSDGRTPSLTAPNPISQYEVQLEAMSGIDPKTVQLVTCHGTGTKLGDQVEVTAIKTSFKPDIRVMSPKSSLGHGEGAAGLIGVLQSLYAMEHSIIPNQLHLQLPTADLGEQISMVFVNEEVDLKRLAISSYGFGGTNCCAILDKPEEKKKISEAYAESKLLMLSAKSLEALKLTIDQYTSFMNETDSQLEDILFSVNARKTKYNVRAAVFGKNREEIARKLKSGDYFMTSLSQKNDTFEVEFGEGNEKLWLLRMLYESNETFRSAVDKYCALAESCGFPEARTALFFPFKLALTPLTYNVSRLISSMATFQLLVEYKTPPTVVRGKGMGHIFALVACNVISFQDGVNLIKTVVADGDLKTVLSKIDMKSSKHPISVGTKATKKITNQEINDEINATALPNLMTFKVNDNVVNETDPIKKVQVLMGMLFVSGFDVEIKYRGSIVRTPGYTFLKRRFWPTPQPVTSTEPIKETDEIEIDYATAVKEIVQKFLEIDDEDLNLLESGNVDSLTSIEMIEAIGTATNRVMPFDLLDNYPTTRAIIEYLNSLAETKASTTKTSHVAKRSVSSASGKASVIACDFKFAGVDGEKELWNTLLTSKLVTGKLSEIREKQIEGNPGLNVGLLNQDISLFDNSFFSIANDEAEFIDPQHRLLLHSAHNALEKSGFQSIPDADLFLAISSHSEYRALAEKRVDELDERLWMGTVHSMAAGRLAAYFGIRGRAILVDTTCSSIASALEMAVESIRNGRKYAIVATSQLIQSSRWLSSLQGLLDHNSTKSFSADGAGFCRSDGVGVIILKSYENGDASLLQIGDAKSHHSGAVITPVVSAISQLLENVGDITYVEGHGTATSAGDSAESMAYQKLGREIVMSSVKAQFGHSEIASGLIQLMKVSALTRTGIIPACVHVALPNEHIRENPKIRLPFVSEETNVEKAAIVSFGITGTKTVVAAEKADIYENIWTPSCCLLPISAKTKDALKKLIESFIEMLANTNEDLYSISLTMQKQKTQFKWRTAVVGTHHFNVIDKLKRVVADDFKMNVQNWHVCTNPYSISCDSFFNDIPEFEKRYSAFCQRLRFEPHSDPASLYHSMAVSYAIVKMIITHRITKRFAVSGFNSLVLLAAVDAAPSHYLNDLMNSFANNDIRMMKRIARDVTIQIDNIEIFDFNGVPITTARHAVDAAIQDCPGNFKFDQDILLLSQFEELRNVEPLQTCSDYWQYVAQKYVQGQALDFPSLFENPCKFIELPEYPFNRKSFWLPIPETHENAAIDSAQMSVNEFLLNSEKWKHVKNHVVDSKIVLPGATSMRIAFEYNGRKPVSLTNIDFLNKILPKEISMTVAVNVENGQCTLSFDELDAISYKLNENVKITPITKENLKAEEKYTDDIYLRFASSQLVYRNQFQMLDSMRHRNGHGEARFNDLADLDILIDGTLQAIVMSYMFENPEDESPFVPFTIDRITIINDNLAGKQLHTSLTYSNTDVFITGNATVYDQDHNVIIHIENVTFKRLNPKSAPTSVVKSAIIKSGKQNEEARKEARKHLHNWFEENFGWTEIDDTVGFFDLGLTSIQAVKLRNAIKSQYPDASSTCIFDYPSVQELSTYLSSLVHPIDYQESEADKEIDELEEDQQPTRVALNPIGVMAASCRLPGGITSPEELWQLLKLGINASSRIPATRIPTRNNLIRGAKYGNPVEGGNFITQDISLFDPAFFKISKSEAEMVDPQQRILLECVQECLENSGVTETSDVGVFVGLMEKEYQEMMESSSILSMLGSMAAVIAGRVNYVFGCHGPSVTIDTACSSSLVALEMAVNALLDKRCSKVIVAGVNLILNEKGQGLRTNGKMLSQHGMSLSFDSRASGYGRSDGCVVLMLELAKPNYHYMSTIQAVNVNHGGRSVSLTAPNGVAHKMLLTSIINASPSLAIDYWEAHGTGTPLGDPIEFNTLSSILQNILIGSVKASLGHGEASAGTCGLLKLFLMLTYQYVPTLIHFHVLNKDINSGSIRLPIIGEDAELTSAGISSFGVSGTNAAAIAFNDNNKLEPYTTIHKTYILPISAKNQFSIDGLEKEIVNVLPVTDVPISHVASTLANNRMHFNIRNALLVTCSGRILQKFAGKNQRIVKKERYRVKLGRGLFEPSLLQFDLINEMYTVASLKNPQHFALKYSIVKFITSLSSYIQVIANDTDELLSILLADGTLPWSKLSSGLFEKTPGSLLNELADMNITIANNTHVKNFQTSADVKEEVHSLEELNKFIINMYINGYDIDWSNVYTPVQKYINLPNYYFNKQPIWFEDRGKIFDHYLIGCIEENVKDKLVLKNWITELRHRYLFRGRPIDVGTIFEIAIEALKVQNELPFSLQNLTTNQITLTRPAWLRTEIEKNLDEEAYSVSAYIEEQLLFTLTATPYSQDEVETPAVDVRIPEKIVHLPDCPSAIIRRNYNTYYVDSTAEVSPFRTANLVLNEIIGFAPNPSDMFLEILGGFPSVYYMVRLDDGALWQFQILSANRDVLSNVYILKDAKGLDIPTIKMHKKSTLLSSQEAAAVAAKSLQLDIRQKVRNAFNDVIDSGMEIDDSQMSTGFTELGMDSHATVDLLNRLNQKYFSDIELTTSDLFDNPNIEDLSVKIEELLREKGISNLPSANPTPKTSLRERKLSIPANRHQELAQIEFVQQYNESENRHNVNTNETTTHDQDEIKRKISTAVMDIATETVTAEDLEIKGFTELGMDSLSIVDFVNRLNEKYFPGEEINTSDVFDYSTVEELAKHISNKKRSVVEKKGNETARNRNEDDGIQEVHLSQAYVLIEDDTITGFDWTFRHFKDGLFQLAEHGSSENSMIISGAGPLKEDDLSRNLSNKTILVDLDDFNGIVENLYLALLNLVKALSKGKVNCKFTVSRNFSLGNTIARAFLKTVTAEKYPTIQYNWNQRIQQVSAFESKQPIRGSWLITGGLSGIGFEIGRYIANNGAQNVILVSRRSPSEEILKDISTWKCKVYTIAADIGDKATLIKELSRINIKITGVVHSAGVLKDSKIERQTKETFNQVFKPKADGCNVLEEIEEHFNYDFEHFIMMSSFTSACGNEGQLNYGVANAYLEYQIKKRRSAGKSGCAIQWGNWIDTGMATSPNIRKFLADLGFLGQHNNDALKYLHMCIEKQPEVIMIANINWDLILKNRKDLPRNLIVEGIRNLDEIISSDEKPEDIKEEKYDIEDEDEMLDFVKEKLAELIKTSPNRVKNNSNLMDIGLDSQLLTQFIHFLNKNFALKLNLSDIYNNSSPEKLSSFLWSQLQQNNDDEKETIAEKIEDVKGCDDFCSSLGMNIFFDDESKIEQMKKVALEEPEKLPKNGTFVVSAIGKNFEEFRKNLENAKSKKVVKITKSVLMLTGQGSQYPMMGRQLCENYAIFRNTLHYCLTECDKHLKGDIPLWEILFNTDHYQLLQLTTNMQPIMFSFGYALAKLWEFLGFVPDYYLGHSVGELAAAVLAGMMGLDDGLKLIVERGKAMEGIAGLGALLAVQKEIADDVIRKYDVCVATINSPKQVVFAGKKDELDKALAFVKGQGKQGTFVNQKYPFHSNLIQESHLQGLRNCLEGMVFHKATIPLISNVSGQMITEFTEEYIIKHTVSAVKFVNCVETLQGLGLNTWVDAGPAAVLATFVKRIIFPSDLPNHRIVQTCKEKDSDGDALLTSCLELEQGGISINWNAVYGCEQITIPSVVDFPAVKSFEIEDDEYEVLKDHKLNERIIVAGVYQVHKMHKFVVERSNDHKLVLRNVKFLKPWFIEEGKTFEIDWLPNMNIELRVKNVVVCSARIEEDDGLSITIPEEGPDEQAFDVSQFYDSLHRNGLQYGPRFRVISEAKRSNKRCLATLKNSNFIWPLIDGAMHSVTSSVLQRRPDCYFLPVALGTITMKSTEVPETSNSTAVIISETDKFIQVNVGLYSGDKTICEIRNMTIVVLNLEKNAESLKNEEEKSEIQIVSFDLSLPLNKPFDKYEGWQFLKTGKVKSNLEFRQENAFVSTLDAEIREWDPEHFGIRPNEAKYMDPQQRLLLTSVAQLLHSASIQALPSNTGVFVGCSTHEFPQIVYAHAKSPKAEWSGGTATSSMAGRIAHWLKLQGPVMNVDTACSSSLAALASACDHLKAGKCDYAIVATINLVLHSMTTNVLSSAQMIVPDFCKVFDIDANGYKRSEAICTMLLTRKDVENSLGTILQWAIGHNGTSSSLYTPNGKSQTELIRMCQASSEGLDIQTHATGTKIGDPIELSALLNAYPEGVLNISALKSNIGHCEGASGLIALCISLIEHQNCYKLPQLHLKLLNSPNSERLRLRFVGEEQESQNVLINNFGFTGTNCSVLLRPTNIAVNESVDTEMSYPMYISASSKKALDKYCTVFCQFVSETNEPLSAISFTLSLEKVYRFRRVLIYSYKRKIICTNGDDVTEETQKYYQAIKRFIDEGILPKITGNRKVDLPPLVFNESYYWDIDEYPDDTCKKPDETTTPNIFYKRLLEPKPPIRVQQNVRTILSYGQFPNIQEASIEKLRDCCTDIIVMQLFGSTEEEFFRLLNLWKNLDQENVKLLIICAQSNFTMYTEWTGTLKSLAAEKLIPYKFVSFEDPQQIHSNELSLTDSYESIFYRNDARFVERLVEEIVKLKEGIRFEKILMSGGTGGIGSAVVDFMNLKNVSIISRTAGTNHIQGNVATVQLLNKGYDSIFHFAGIVDNETHQRMTNLQFQNTFEPKVKGAKNLLSICNRDAEFKFSSSVACIFGSFGQSNYAFANGLAASILEKSEVNSDVIHFGAWKDVGMLARQECGEIRKQLNHNGWRMLSNTEALSVFKVRKSKKKRDIIVFNGDFEEIIRRSPYLRPLLSKLVKVEESEINNNQKASFEDIFFKITGIKPRNDVDSIPFMDLGIDSLCIENLRQTIEIEMDIKLSLNEIFDNANYSKMRDLINKKKNEGPKKVTFNIATNEDGQIDERIAVIGWSAEFSNVENISEFWEELMAGKSLLEEDGTGRLKHPDDFDNTFFNITDEDSKVLDSQIKKFIQHAYWALENSGYIKVRSNLRCAVFAGAEPTEKNIEEQPDAMRRMFAINMNNYLASYAAYCLDLQGEATSVYTACSTSLVAVAHAVKCLQRNEADLALAGAASIALSGIMDEKKTVFAGKENFRPFDKDSTGIARGSGVGCLVLKRLDKAVKDNDNIYCVIKNFSICNDGISKASFMAPNPSGQLRCINGALLNLTDEEKQRIRYIECHATGTPLGDSIELNSLKDAYNFKTSLTIGSCKANIGHAYAASGLASIIKSAMILKSKLIPPQINFNQFREDYGEFLNINTKAMNIETGSIIAIDCFGIGGTNVHMLIEEGPALAIMEKVPKNCAVIPVSAKSFNSLNAQKQAIVKYQSENLLTVQSISTLQHHRENYSHRSFLIAKENDIIHLGDNVTSKLSPKVCFFLAPQGIQFSNLFPFDNEHSAYHVEINRLCGLASQICKKDFEEILNSNNRLNDVENTQVGLFIQCMAIARTLQESGIEPDLLAGHSLGEYTCAALSGVLIESDAFNLLNRRSKLIGTTPETEMIMVWGDICPPKCLEETAIVSDKIRCFVGYHKDVQPFSESLKARGIKYKMVGTQFGFHSSFMNPISYQFRRLCDGFKFREGCIPWISSITGEKMTTLSSDYCTSHLSSSINLKLLVEALIAENIDIIVEIGPSGVLESLLQDIGSKIVVIPTCGRKSRPLPSLEICKARAWSHGINIKFEQECSSIDPKLPGYQFEAHRQESVQIFKQQWIPIADEVVKEDLDAKIYELPADCKDVNSIFYDCMSLAKYGKSKLIIISNTLEPAHYLALGVLRNSHITNGRRMIFVENPLNLQTSDVVKMVSSMTEDIVRISMNECHFLDYKPTRFPEIEMGFVGIVAVLFGANGFVGRCYDRVLRQHNFKVVRVAKTNSDVNCNITIKQSVIESLRTIQKKHGRISLMINCVGKDPSTKLCKSRKEQDEILSSKTIANMNIIEAVIELDIVVEKFIMCSSLSSVIPLLGCEDYSSANCFVDRLAHESHPCIQERLAIALPPIIGSRMFEESKSSVKNVLKSIAISEDGLERLLWATIGMSGAIYLCKRDLKSMVYDSIRYHTSEYSTSTKSNSIKMDIIEIWKDTISHNIDINDETNFFEIGGDSLSALQVTWKVKCVTGKEVHVDDLFLNPTVQGYANYIKNLTDSEKDMDVGINDFSTIPLTNAQMQMFILRQTQEPTRYNLIFQIIMKIEDQFDYEKFQNAIFNLIGNQTSYRTCFRNIKGPIQSVASLTESFYDLTPNHTSKEEWNEIIQGELHYIFDILSETPLRIIMAKVDGMLLVLFNQHHILSDGWSMTVFADEITRFYNENLKRQVQSMSKLGVIEQLQTKETAKRVEEAANQLKNYEHCVIPYDQLDVECYKKMEFLIPSRLWHNLLTTSKKFNTTPYNVALTLFCKTLKNFIMTENLLFAYASSGRNEHSSNLIGYCMNNVLFHCSIMDGIPFKECLEAVIQSVSQYKDIPFHKIVEIEKHLGAISIYFNFRQKLDYPTVNIPNAQCEIQHISLNSAFDFSFTIDETPNGTLISVDYDSGKYKSRTIEQVVQVFLKSIQIDKPTIIDRIARADYPLSLLPKEQIIEWHSSSAHATHEITYKGLAEELQSTANNIENEYCIQNGRTPREDDAVAIESCEITIFACFLLGVAYVPMDSTWSEERKNIAQRLSQLNWNGVSKRAAKKLRVFSRRSPFGMIYNLLTSGSTGRPKGVAMGQQSVSSFVTSATKTCLFRSGHWILDSVNKVFDVSVSNIFGCFLNYGTLVPNDSSYLSTTHYAFIPSAVFNSFDESALKRLSVNEIVTVGGDTIATIPYENAINAGIHLIQIYGPTETCVWSLIARCKTGNCANLGNALENERARVKCNYKIGELVIQGVSVARGYTNGIAFNSVYCTGDIVENRDGRISFVGRLDDQVKFKGIRINLKELEQEMCMALGIQQIKLIMLNQQLIAFLVTQDSVDFNSINFTHRPDHFVTIEKMPLNASGKVDAKILLQAFEQLRKSYKREIEMMRNSLEDQVLDVVSTAIGQRADLCDKFSNIGGNSLSAIQVAHKLSEIIGSEVKAHDVLQSGSLKNLVQSISGNVEIPNRSGMNVITKLREAPDSNITIYLIHAIGGTIYPYYSFLQIFPKNFSIYGIEFDLDYPSNDLKELSRFYAREIASHASDKGFKNIFVMGHSMGGIMSREIVAELKIWGFEIPFVILFDSWVLRTNELDIENIKNFITLKLAKLLREYKTSVSDTKLYLFKSKSLGDAAFKKAVRVDLNEELSRSMVFNGFDELSLQPIDTYLIDGDHESCLKIENLRKVKNEILAPFQPYL
ncbi:unnamed protein product [Caenorhabditis bovis]|uniref:Fatty acid synthase n=1 Tax=Caenorhabditis bovis TaxID=2654633 RepID=A0A8S1F928_9PELO|nr:unnamed protein product [Caenorhabditis bovis]